jgi:hypothetical protein
VGVRVEVPVVTLFHSITLLGITRVKVRVRIVPHVCLCVVCVSVVPARVVCFHAFVVTTH